MLKSWWKDAKEMKFLIFTIMLVTTPIVCMAEYKTGNVLKADCESTSLVNQGICLGYVMGVADALAKQKICAPLSVTAGQLESVTKKYLNEFPERLHYSADSLVTDALSKAFPCTGKR